VKVEGEVASWLLGMDAPASSSNRTAAVNNLTARITCRNALFLFLFHAPRTIVVVVVVLYSPNTNRYITDTCTTKQ